MSDATRVLQRLIERAQVDTVIACPPAFLFERAVRAGKPIPDFAKPGYLLRKLPPDELEMLAGLTSEETRKHGWIDINAQRDVMLRYEEQRNRNRR